MAFSAIHYGNGDHEVPIELAEDIEQPAFCIASVFTKQRGACNAGGDDYPASERAIVAAEQSSRIGKTIY